MGKVLWAATISISMCILDIGDGRMEADVETIAVLRDGYARDCKRLFYYGDIVEKGIL